MLKKILSRTTCAACQLCCQFDASDIWELPVLPAETVAAIQKYRPETAFVPVGAAVAIRSGNAHDVQQKRLVEFRIKVQASCGEGSQGFSVVGVAQGHETYFLAVSGLVVVLKTHFHRGFDGCRTVIREIEFAEPPRNFLH